MIFLAPRKWSLRVGIAAALVFVAATPGFAQPNPSLKPTYGSVTLKAGFLPDPYIKKLTAGGNVRTNLGGVNSHVAQAPDFTLQYTKGRYPLTIHALSDGDTTILVHLPNGKWLANDDGGKGLNPLLRITSPESGDYKIWVGTYGTKTIPASLHITERTVDTKGPVVASGSVPSEQQGTAINNVLARLSDLEPNPTELTLHRTNSNHVLTTYSAITEHIQGITMIGDTYLIAHSVKKGKAPMMVAVSSDRTTFHLIGDSKFPHAGALQACGNIVALPCEPYYGGGKHDGLGSELRFVNCSNPHAPVLLSTKISRKVRHAASAGLAYYAQHKCHYALVYDDGQVELYKSNGHAIGSPQCQFEEIVSTRPGHGSQGGMQLLYDASGKLYVAAMDNENSRDAARETIRLIEIQNPQSKTAVRFKLVKEHDLGAVHLSVVQREPSFRWGGALVAKGPNRLEAYAASRLLLYAPLVEQHTKVKRWTPDKTVTLIHGGGYVARFTLTWTSNGKGHSWKSGNKTLGWRDTINLPADATNIRLRAEAAVFISTWRDIANQIVAPGTYEVYGTTGSRKMKKI